MLPETEAHPVQRVNVDAASGDAVSDTNGIPRSATAIQTQAPVNFGNSGGPLLNDEGAIVGIVVGSAIETQGIYFAIAVQHVRELLTR